MTIAASIRAIHELIDALDRRRPRIGHPAEVTIARDAASLRAQGLRRITELERELADVD